MTQIIINIQDDKVNIDSENHTQSVGFNPEITMPSPCKATMQGNLFKSIWETIKKWDIAAPPYYDGYCSANGSHVQLIIDAVIRAKEMDVEEQQEIIRKTNNRTNDTGRKKRNS